VRSYATGSVSSRANEKLTAFLELELPVRICIELACQAGEIFGKTYGNQGLDPGEGASPDSFFPSFRPAAAGFPIGGTERFVL